MEITKAATTINEQISILRTRGMIIEDEKKAIENLLDIGYYRLGFYWFPFEKSYPRKHQRNHIFKEGTNFDYAIKLYYFDFDLRNLFLRYISRIEINFRTTLIYQISNKYKDDSFWYINPKVIRECREIVRTLFYQYILIKNLLANAKKNGNYEKEFSLFMEKLTSEHSCPTGRNRNLFRLLFLLFSF